MTAIVCENDIAQQGVKCTMYYETYNHCVGLMAHAPIASIGSIGARVNASKMTHRALVITGFAE